MALYPNRRLLRGTQLERRLLINEMPSVGAKRHGNLSLRRRLMRCTTDRKFRTLGR